MTEFSDRLKYAMQQSDLTQTALSQRCGSIAQTTLSGYIRGKHYPSDEKMKILADALGVRYEWLRDGESEETEYLDAGQADAGDADQLNKDQEEKVSQADDQVGTDAQDQGESAIIRSIVLQFSGEDMPITDLKERCRNAWKQEFGEGEIKKLAVYIRPEERKAYWVVNGEQSGVVGI